MFMIIQASLFFFDTMSIRLCQSRVCPSQLDAAVSPLRHDKKLR